MCARSAEAQPRWLFAPTRPHPQGGDTTCGRLGAAAQLYLDTPALDKRHDRERAGGGEGEVRAPSKSTCTWSCNLGEELPR